MRVATVALGAIPVVLGGLGIAMVAGGTDPLDASVPASEDSPIAPETTSGGSSRDSDSGTPIDGQRPHLSVIDGHANLFLPAPLPAIISPLPGGATELAPLPPARDRGDSPSSPRAGTGSGTAERQTAPDSDQPPEPSAGERPSASPARIPDVPAGQRSASDPFAPQPREVPRSDRDLPRTKTGEKMNHGRPPHADTRGRPAHAGKTGRPDHANGKPTSQGRHGGTGSPGQAATGSRPDHAGTSGRPDHAAGGARKSDDSRPGPR